MADSPKDKTRSPTPLKSKLVRSQKIIQLPTSETTTTRERPPDIPEDAELPSNSSNGNFEKGSSAAPQRSHTPGHLSTKSQDRRKRSSELSIRQRSQSFTQKDSPSTGTSSPRSASSKPPSVHGNGSNTPKLGSSNPLSPSITSPKEVHRPVNLRSTSAIASKPQSSPNITSPSTRPITTPTTRPSRGPHIPFPPLPDPKTAPTVPPAPASGMYWSLAPLSGLARSAVRAHTSTLIGSNIYIFGGCDSRCCFNELSVLDADAFYLSTPHIVGEIPVPLRAMTCTAVGKKLVVFGGGDGPAYYNDVYVLDTQNFRWSKPKITSEKTPSKRRAHTACLYKSGIYIFGGGDGVRALNDVWRLDVSDMKSMSWKLISAASTSTSPSSSSTNSPSTTSKDVKPKARGYHTANMVGSKLIIFGGSDGGECFRDVWIFDVETLIFSPVIIPISCPRLSHTATIVGSYLFVIGGHDGVEYSNEVLLLNLVTMNWDKRMVYGERPKARGYHGAVLNDSRVIVTGGFDGGEVFGDVWVLELAVHAYFSQISHFSIDV